MARIAVLVSNPCTGDARVIKMARTAAKAGHDVHVFATAGPNTRLYEVYEGVTYHRLLWRLGQLLTSKGPLRLTKKISRKFAVMLVKRITPYVKYSLFRKVYSAHVARLEPDIVHAHDLICLPAAHAGAQACGAKLIYDAHELEVHRNPPLSFLQKMFVAHVEKKYARKADAVITVGRLVGEVLGKHIKRDDINIIYNSPILGECLSHIRGDLCLPPEIPIILYVGKVTMGRGVGDILRILPHMREVFFATVGPCDEKSRKLLKRQANRLGVANRFRILPEVPFEQVVDYVRGADLGVISVEPVTLSYQYCMPNKLFELSFANIPIISNELDEVAEFLKENGNGETVDFEELSSLSYTIYRMIKDKDRYLMDEQSREQLFNKYSWDTQCHRLLNIYEKVLSDNPAVVSEGFQHTAIS
jgi:glycosyltransferase involved in cell wall biosynthesis